MYYGFGSESGTRLFIIGVLSAVGCRLAGPFKLALGLFPFERMPTLSQLREGVSPSPAGEACVGAVHCATNCPPTLRGPNPHTGIVMALVDERHHHLSLPFLLLVMADSFRCVTLFSYQMLCLAITGMSALTALYNALRPLAELACTAPGRRLKLTGNPEFVLLQLDGFHLLCFLFARLLIFTDHGRGICSHFCRGPGTGPGDVMCGVNLGGLISYAGCTLLETSDLLRMLNTCHFRSHAPDELAGDGDGQEAEERCLLCDETSMCSACAEKMTGVALNYRPTGAKSARKSATSMVT